jgi:hypothetical protein
LNHHLKNKLDMKKLIVFSILFVAATFISNNAYAQQCCKSKSTAGASCSKDKASSTASVAKSEAMLVAMKDQNVVEKVCATSGTVSYQISKVDLASGEASISEVAFDENLAKFVNVSPTKSCMAKDAAEAKSCAGKAEGKACCKAKASSASVEATPEAKPTKTSL